MGAKRDRPSRGGAGAVDAVEGVAKDEPGCVVALEYKGTNCQDGRWQMADGSSRGTEYRASLIYTFYLQGGALEPFSS